MDIWLRMSTATSPTFIHDINTKLLYMGKRIILIAFRIYKVLRITELAL
jgi:hypothetical protein